LYEINKKEEDFTMNTVDKLTYWGETHHPVWLDFFRMAFGVLLFVKGIQLVASPHELVMVINGVKHNFLSLAILHYAIFVNLVGGVLITIGLITRTALAFNFPVLLGAIIFSNANMGVFSAFAVLPIAIILLLLCIVFLIYGSGPLSVDSFMRKHPNS
jgi:putative oxidoreductase